MEMLECHLILNFILELSVFQDNVLLEVLGKYLWRNGKLKSEDQNLKVKARYGSNKFILHTLKSMHFICTEEGRTLPLKKREYLIQQLYI